MLPKKSRSSADSSFTIALVDLKLDEARKRLHGNTPWSLALSSNWTNIRVLDLIRRQDQAEY